MSTLLRRVAPPETPVMMAVASLVALVGCSESPAADSNGSPDAWIAPDAMANEGRASDAPADDSPPQGHVAIPTSGFCALPGSVVYGAGGARVVLPGGGASTDFSWLTLPDGFCVHLFANVPNPREIRFAPGGELFVASPSASTQGGGMGEAAVLVLADDDSNGVADIPYTVFLDDLPSTQGMLFTPGSFFYQDLTVVRRLDYQRGQRQAPGPGQEVVNVAITAYGLHWPKSLDMADDGTIYVTSTSDDGEVCYTWRPFVGGILRIDGSEGGREVAMGMRNPFVIRCRRGHGDCFALELTADYSGDKGGQEKLLRIENGADYGYPCCAAPNTPFEGVFPLNDAGREEGTPNCAQVSPEIDAWIVGRTPMGLDFERGRWPAPWTNSAIVSMHGAFGSWAGAKVMTIDTDPATGRPLPASELDGGNASAFRVFATGWDDGKHDHGRPEDLTFSPDGRLFLTNDVIGDIVWIAPVGLTRTSSADGGGDASEASAPDASSSDGASAASDADASANGD